MDFVKSDGYKSCHGPFPPFSRKDGGGGLETSKLNPFHGYSSCTCGEKVIWSQLPVARES